MDPLATIYGIQGADGLIVYVGQTINRLDHRFRQHCKSRWNPRLYQWLLENKASIVELEAVPREDKDFWELWWIQYMRAIGCPLMNRAGVDFPFSRNSTAPSAPKPAKVAPRATRAPAAPRVKPEHVYLRVEPDQMRNWGKAAALDYRSLPNWIRHVCNEAAKGAERKRQGRVKK